MHPFLASGVAGMISDRSWCDNGECYHADISNEDCAAIYVQHEILDAYNKVAIFWMFVQKSYETWSRCKIFVFVRWALFSHCGDARL